MKIDLDWYADSRVHKRHPPGIGFGVVLFGLLWFGELSAYTIISDDSVPEFLHDSAALFFVILIQFTISFFLGHLLYKRMKKFLLNKIKSEGKALFIADMIDIASILLAAILFSLFWEGVRWAIAAL